MQGERADSGGAAPDESGKCVRPDAGATTLCEHSDHSSQGRSQGATSPTHGDTQGDAQSRQRIAAGESADRALASSGVGRSEPTGEITPEIIDAVIDPVDGGGSVLNLFLMNASARTPPLPDPLELKNYPPAFQSAILERFKAQTAREDKILDVQIQEVKEESARQTRLIECIERQGEIEGRLLEHEIPQSWVMTSATFLVSTGAAAAAIVIGVTDGNAATVAALTALVGITLGAPTITALLNRRRTKPPSPRSPTHETVGTPPPP